MKTVRMTVGQALVRFLDNQYLQVDGDEIKFVEGIFGIFGHGVVVGLGEAIQEPNHSLTFYQGRNEQGMAHCALAYAKQNDRKRIIAVTSSIGPGALNMVTAAGTATSNRIPLLLLPGDVFACRQPDPVLQQIEQSSDYTITANDAFKAVSKYWDRITRPEQLMSAAINAMRVLTDPAETGTVVLALPQDVQGEAYDYPQEFLEKRVHHFSRRPLAEGEADRIVELISRKKRPLIICGGGVRYSGAGEALGDFSRRFGIPLAETQAGKGVVAWDSTGNLGGLGVTGTLAANRIAREADLVLAVGTRLNDFHTASKSAFSDPDLEIVAINVNAFDAYKMNAQPFLADARTALGQITPLLQNRGYTGDPAYVARVRDLKDEWNREVDRLYGLDDRQGLTQTRVIGEMNRFLGAGDVIVAASGSLPSDLERLWRPADNASYHLEYGFSCMGYEVPGALGAKLAVKDRGEVYALVGDGGFLMLHTELLTSLQERQKIIIVVVDNKGFHCIDNLQSSKGIPHFGCEFRYRDTASGTLSGEDILVDYAALARAYGCDAHSVKTAEELVAALKAARDADRTVLIDVKTLKKSMTDGYETWWRVGIPEVSPKSKVMDAYREQQEMLQKVRLF
ncbi:MAG: 3D-(3,5/4)-trihydroxycyclohexane-1,2-dione acylhydrolase (decyclizing) [Spirochaetaceae bacterium]|nr:MAG: 3D-(3,5/4)-trihydroxycyclohexane-1,2-dione acylhydrolase (decyclizing) [Spirochaetaceae bacterium]